MAKLYDAKSSTLMPKPLIVTALLHHQHFVAQIPAPGDTRGLEQSWVCFNLGSTPEFNNKMKNIISFMSVSVLKGWAIKLFKQWMRKACQSSIWYLKQKGNNLHLLQLCHISVLPREKAAGLKKGYHESDLALTDKASLSLIWHLLIKLHWFVI